MISTAQRNKANLRTAVNIKTLRLGSRMKFERFVKDVYNQLGILIVMYSGSRDMLQQWELRKIYLNGGDLAASPGSSYHNYDRAGDFAVVVGNGSYNYYLPNDVIEIGERNGLVSGRSFGDRPHMQDSDGVSIAELKKGNSEVGKYKVLEQQLNLPPKPEYFRAKKKYLGVKITAASLILIGAIYGLSILRKKSK